MSLDTFSAECNYQFFFFFFLNPENLINLWNRPMTQILRVPSLLLTSFLSAGIGVLALFDSQTLAQVNGPGPSPSSSFDTVLNLPGDEPPIENSAVRVGGVPGQTTQINITDGSAIDRRFFADAGSEVNISGGSVSTAFVANSGSEVNLSGGTVVYGFNEPFSANSGSNVNISGGAVTTRFNARSGSLVNISGGTFGDVFGISSGSLVNISGGTFGDQFRAFTGSEVNISGGIFDDNFFITSGSEVNFFGSEFQIDGSVLNNLLPGETFTITDRDVTLSGVLAGGEQFSFDLNTARSPGNDFFSPEATLTVTIAVPEPTSLTLIAMVLTMGFAQRRRP
jgi:hypothetical protein